MHRVIHLDVPSELVVDGLVVQKHLIILQEYESQFKVVTQVNINTF